MRADAARARARAPVQAVRPRDLGEGPGPASRAPADLRLVLPALSAWAAAALALGASGVTVAVGCGIAAVAAVVLLALVRRRGGAARAGTAPAASRASAAGSSAPVRRRPGGPTHLIAVATALLCAACAAAVAALHAADTRRGPVPRLAERYAVATVEVELTADPRPTRPRVRGAVRAPAGVLIEAEALRVGSYRVRTPVLLLAPGRAAWRGLLPSTRLRVRGRLAPPAYQGDRFAAVLRVSSRSAAPAVTKPPTRLQRAAGRLRAGLREATDRLPADARALLPGLVIGDTSRVPSSLDAAFHSTDLTHLLAVSGANFTIVLALLIGPPHLALRAERRGLAPRLGLSLRTTAVCGGALALGFVAVCRPEPSVLRAAGCGLVVLLAIGTGRRRSLLPALAAVVIALVLYDPWLARAYGFLLSVLATGALLTLAPRWAAALRRRGLPPRPAEVLAATAAAQAVCAPVVTVFAARVSLVAIPCNLLAELAVAPATVLGFAALAVAAVSLPVAKALAWLAVWPTEWIAGVARTGAGLPGAELGWPGGLRGAALLAAATVALLGVGRRIPGRPWAYVGCVLLLLVAVIRPPPLTRVLTGWPPTGWRMVACDVGQGDALVLAAGPATALVVDTGPEPRLVDRCLRDLGVERIPLLVLTHFHADHVDGLRGALHGRAVGGIETTDFDEPPGQVALVRRIAARAHVPLIRAAAGERRHLGDLSWQVLWPPAPDQAPPGPGSGAGTPPQAPGPAAGAPRDGAASPAFDGPNDASVTLLVRTAGLTLLLPGDLEPSSQQRLLAAYPEIPHVDVLKVPHHGSAYQDPALLVRARPQLAIISVGAGNPYGHPAPRTIEALRRPGATVLRTDRDGAVAVVGRGAAGLGAVVAR